MLNGRPKRVDSMTRIIREQMAATANICTNSIMNSGSIVAGLPGLRRVVTKFSTNDDATMTATIAGHPRENCSTAR